MTIDNCDFDLTDQDYDDSDSYFKYFTVMYSTGTDADITISNSKFYTTADFNDTYVYEGINFNTDDYKEAGVSDYEGVIYIANAKSVTSSANSFYNNYIYNNGLIYLKNVAAFEDSESEFSNNAALSGGVIYAESSFLEITSSYFSYNYA